jgi:deazaflavin-dependent oxidoreductase (nitroreductase family)
MKQAVLNRVKALNKHVTNRLLIHLCGREFGHFAVLSHTGRKSGKLYRIPIIAEPVEGGFVIALTYGKEVDWFKNVMAKGGCSIYWKKQEYQVFHPHFVEKEVGLLAFPKVVQAALRTAGIEYFLMLETEPEIGSA